MPEFAYLIVGGGMTAAAAAKGIREVDGAGKIGILAAESHRPYARPPNGKKVTMVFPENGVCARAFPADLTDFVTGYYREKGVDVRAGESVTGIERTSVVTKNGRIDADAIVAGIGIAPSTELAKQAGLTVTDGVEVDEALRTSDLDIFAAGDLANFHNPALGKRIRVEHEDNANTMGAAAGRSMAGASVRYDHLPFFYSDLFDLGYEAVGEIDARHRTVADWKTPFREGVVYYLDKERVRG